MGERGKRRLGLGLGDRDRVDTGDTEEFTDVLPAFLDARVPLAADPEHCLEDRDRRGDR
jgi:hypothetical protein